MSCTNAHYKVIPFHKFNVKTKELMHCHCGTNNRAPQWTFSDPCKPEVRPGAKEESAFPAWLALPAMNACDTTKVYIWRFDTGCRLTLYRKCHSHNTPYILSHKIDAIANIKFLVWGMTIIVKPKVYDGS